jgi:hypothetical protein
VPNLFEFVEAAFWIALVLWAAEYAGRQPSNIGGLSYSKRLRARKGKRKWDFLKKEMQQDRGRWQ